MKAISLFSGAGGMDVGFKAAGFEVIIANELDNYACKTFRANHPEVNMLEGDIEKYMSRLCSYKDIDIIFGGPPCQGFSVAGKMDLEDPRSKLIFSFCEVVNKVKPKAFVMENVKALGVLSKFKGIRDTLVSNFQSAGYTVSMHILNSREFGVPQSRERVFFIGILNQITPIHSSCFRKHKKDAPTLREVLLPLGKPGTNNNTRICKARITLAAKPILRKSPYAGMLFNGQGRPLNPDGWASTLPASMGGNRTPIIDDRHLYDGNISWVEEYHKYLMAGGSPRDMHDTPSFLRRLTIDEAALLQTFPKNYIWIGPDSKVFNQIGNAVPCDLAKAVASSVRDKICDDLVSTPTGFCVDGSGNLEFLFA